MRRAMLALLGCLFGAVGCGGGEEGYAAASPQGGEGQTCYPNITCNAGLTCASGLCVRLDAGVDATGGGAGDAGNDADSSPADSGNSADGSAGNDGQAVNQCQPDDIRCDGNTPQMCGATGVWLNGAVCKSGPCNAGECLPGVLSSGLGTSTVLDMAAGGGGDYAPASGGVFWIASEDNTIHSMSPSNSAPWGTWVDLFPEAIAVNSNGMAWLASASQGQTTCDVLGTSYANHDTSTYATGQRAHGSIAIDPNSTASPGAYVYWVDYDMGNILRMASPPNAGELPTVLVAQQHHPTRVIVDATNLYWVTDDNTIVKMAKTGQGGTTVLASDPVPRKLAVNSKSLYWVNEATSCVATVGIDGGTPFVLAANQPHLNNIAVDETHVYWTSDGSVLRASVTGGTPTVLYSDANVAIDAMTIDAANLYWASCNTATGDHSIMYVTK